MDETPRAYEKREGDQVVVTRNSVYVLRDGICVAVRSRSRAIDEWDASHKAIGMRARGGLLLGRDSLGFHEEVQPGDRLCLEDALSGRALLTSEVLITAILRKSLPQNPNEIVI